MSALDVEAIETRLRERGIANYDGEVALVARVRELEAALAAARDAGTAPRRTAAGRRDRAGGEGKGIVSGPYVIRYDGAPPMFLSTDARPGLTDCPSCCDAARTEHEATMERVMSELAGEARAANARGEAAWDRVMADSGDERAAAVAEYEARR